MCMCVSVRWLDPTALCHVLISTRLCADRCQCAHEPATEHKKALRQRFCTVVYVLLVVDVLFLADGTAQSKPHRSIVVPHPLRHRSSLCRRRALLVEQFNHHTFSEVCAVGCWVVFGWYVLWITKKKTHTHKEGTVHLHPDETWGNTSGMSNGKIG